MKLKLSGYSMIKTRISKIETEKLEKGVIKKAAEVIKNGGLVIYPTETCYGLGGDATNIKSIKRIYRIKKRSKTKPIPILVSDLKMMKKYGEITNRIRILINKFMPGPLTIITRKKESIPDVLNPKEIAFRISSHPVANELVKEVGSPITTTSANISGQPAIYKIDKIIRTFNGKVEMILDSGDLPKTEPSTYVDMKNEKVKIIREGPINKRRVLKVVRK